ncbi:MAG: methyltransferase family protein [Vicinamibacterales bacterium]
MITRLLARWRVSLGLVLAVAALWLATPTRESLMVGALIAWCGEALRVWAAGHLEKGTEVTRSGPYRFTRHPLYLGSTLIGVGLAVAAYHLVLGILIVVYLATTLTAAMRSEEAHLREKFGDAYAAYAEERAAPMARAFSWARALRNREHHAIAGLTAGLLALATKAGLGP